jgi:hypothetical protein
MIDLYHHGSSVCAAKVRLALGEKGLAWEGHYLDIHKGDQFAPEYLKLNPKAVVPTLVHNGRVILESTVINEYLKSGEPCSAGRRGKRLRSLINHKVLGSESAVQGIILGPGNRLFDAGKVITKQFLGLRAGDVQISAIDECHGDLRGHEGAGSSGGIFGDGHRSSSC